MPSKTAKAALRPIRQSTQYNCMTVSMAMCLEANGVAPEECSTEVVNKVMGARPMKGAAWESALACAQHYGMRATLTTPSTVKQLKAWTDRGIPVMIAWNPEGRDWSHASTVYDVTVGLPEPLPASVTVIGSGPGLYIWVADPNIPNPDKLTRAVHEDDFYGKWYEKWPDYLVRRPACAIEPEITSDGRQVMASVRTASDEFDWEAFARDLKKTLGQKYPVSGSVLGRKWDSGGVTISTNWGRDYFEDEDWDDDLLSEIIHAVAKKHRLKHTGRNHDYLTPDGSKVGVGISASTHGGGLQRFAGRSPNQSGSSAMLKRQGLVPVDLYNDGKGGFVSNPHRRSIIMQGEQVQDKRGTVWFFVGTDAKGKAILAKTEREMKSMSDQLIEDRKRHNVAKAKRAKKPLSRKDKLKTPTKTPKRRNEVVRGLIERGTSGQGHHQNKGQRGTGEKGSGKRQRHQKHKQDLRQQQHAAAVDRVASAFLFPKQASAESWHRLTRNSKSKINSALRKGGLDGNGRFRKPEQGYSKAVDILDDWGIELDTVVSSHLFNQRPTGTLRVEVAFTNEEDRFSPISITNSVLYLQFTELRDGVFEAVAYMS